MTMPNDNENHEASGTGAVFSDPETVCAEIEAYISEKPFQSLAIALLVGVVVGKIIL